MRPPGKRWAWYASVEYCLPKVLTCIYYDFLFGNIFLLWDTENLSRERLRTPYPVLGIDLSRS